MNYLTVEELQAYIRESEALDQANDTNFDGSINYGFYETMIASASARMDSMLGSRYSLPLPLSAHVKTLCYPIAHWWSENAGLDKRDFVQKEYDEAIKALEAIACGDAVLIGVDGKPALQIVDANTGLPGIQSMGASVGTRSGGWTTVPRIDRNLF